MSTKQIVAGLIVNISNLIGGIAMGWTSPMLPVLTSNGTDSSPIKEELTADTLSWIGSLLPVGALIAPFLGGFLADKFGRKITMLVNSCFFTISFVLMAFQPTIVKILIARLLQGFAVGISMTVQTMYIGEIASDDLRGALGSFMQLFTNIGFLIVNSIGPYLSFEHVQLVLLAFPLIFVILFGLMPESPYYYMGKNNPRDALKSLSFLRGKPKGELTEEISIIETNVANSKTEQGGFKDLFRRGNLKALIICSFLICVQQLSGINGILFYTTSIFQDSGSSIKPEIATIIVCVVQVIASLITPFVAYKWGRKSILLFSTTIATIFLSSFAVYKYGTEVNNAFIASLNWLPITSLIGYLVAFSCGLGAIPYAIASEVFSPSIKSKATPIITTIAWTMSFLVTKYFQSVSMAIGSYWVFGMFAVVAASGFIFTYFVVFETKGLSLNEVQEKLNKK